MVYAESDKIGFFDLGRDPRTVFALVRNVRPVRTFWKKSLFAVRTVRTCSIVFAVRTVRCSHLFALVRTCSLFALFALVRTCDTLSRTVPGMKEHEHGYRRTRTNTEHVVLTIYRTRTNTEHGQVLIYRTRTNTEHLNQNLPEHRTRSINFWSGIVKIIALVSASAVLNIVADKLGPSQDFC